MISSCRSGAIAAVFAAATLLCVFLTIGWPQLSIRGAGLQIGVATEPHDENSEQGNGKSGQSVVEMMKPMNNQPDRIPGPTNNVAQEIFGLLLLVLSYLLLLWGVGAMRIFSRRLKFLGGLGILAALVGFYQGFHFLTGIDPQLLFN